MCCFEKKISEEFGPDYDKDIIFPMNINSPIVLNKYILILWRLVDERIFVANIAVSLGILNFIEILFSTDVFSTCYVSLVGLVVIFIDFKYFTINLQNNIAFYV